MRFADTAFFLALLNPRDQWHSSALAVSRGVADDIVTTAWIMMEIGNGLARTPNRIWFPDFVMRLQSSAQVLFIPATMEWFESGLRLYEERPDKEWEKEQKQREVELKEREALEKKNRDREKEEFTYLFKRDQQAMRDRFNDEKAKLEKENQQKREVLGKEMADREQAVAAKESELAQFHNQVAAFPKELEKVYAIIYS